MRTLRTQLAERLRWLFTDERAVMGVITLNAFVLFLAKFPELGPYQLALRVIDDGFTVFFATEAILKIRASGFRGYLSVGWNRFDGAVVLLTLPTLLEYVVDVPDISFLLLLRVARVAKFFRFIRFVPDIQNLLDGAFRAARASVFVLMAFVLFNFMVALFSCYLFQAHAPEHFANPLVAFYSIFRVFTIEGWYEIPDAIVASSDSAALGIFARLYFMGVVVSGGLFGLSLVNAIFVDEMLKNESGQLEEHLRKLEAKVDRLLAAQPSAPGGSAPPPGLAAGPDAGAAPEPTAAAGGAGAAPEGPAGAAAAPEAGPVG